MTEVYKTRVTCRIQMLTFDKENHYVICGLHRVSAIISLIYNKQQRKISAHEKN